MEGTESDTLMMSSLPDMETYHRLKQRVESSVDMNRDVLAFGKKYGIVDGRDNPRVLDHTVAMFRSEFLLEETVEFMNATMRGDVELALDSLIDLVYVALGTAHMMGITAGRWDHNWRDVQRANMSKVRVDRAEDSKRGSSFDVVKPPGWIAPTTDVTTPMGDE